MRKAFHRCSPFGECTSIEYTQLFENVKQNLYNKEFSLLLLSIYALPQLDLSRCIQCNTTLNPLIPIFNNVTFTYLYNGVNNL